MIIVSNRVSECRNKNKKVLPRAAVRYLVIHRTDLNTFDPFTNPRPVPDDKLDGPALAKRFQDAPAAHPAGLGTGGLTPYHFLIRANAPLYTVEQILPLTLRGAHTIGFNWQSWGIALVGDFRKASPPPTQYVNLVSLVAMLLPTNGGLQVMGHTDAPDTSVDPGKRCPGVGLSTAQITADTIGLLPAEWTSWGQDQIDLALLAAGITI